MWFKNLSVFRLTEAFTLTPSELEQKLEALSFRPCGPHDNLSEHVKIVTVEKHFLRL